jgi:hypothetical protein
MAVVHHHGAQQREELARVAAAHDLVPRWETEFAVTVLWLCLSSIPALCLFSVGVRLSSSSGIDVSAIPLLLLWGACAGLTAPIYLRHLGVIEPVAALRPAAAAPHHLPPACAGFLEEARAIRTDPAELDHLLRRAWELMQDVERAEPSVHAFLEQTGATLRPIRELLETRATSGRSRATKGLLHERLLAALASFENALRHPRSAGFR